MGSHWAWGEVSLVEAIFTHLVTRLVSYTVTLCNDAELPGGTLPVLGDLMVITESLC